MSPFLALVEALGWAPPLCFHPAMPFTLPVQAVEAAAAAAEEADAAGYERRAGTPLPHARSLGRAAELERLAGEVQRLSGQATRLLQVQ